MRRFTSITLLFLFFSCFHLCFIPLFLLCGLLLGELTILEFHFIYWLF